jgi:hypothetical protein
MADCPVHPGEPAIGACARCGRFFCAKERILLDAKPYCGDCGARPDVDWLGHHYRALEGTRSGVAWAMGLFGLGLVLGGLTLVFTSLEHWKGAVAGFGLFLFGASAATTFVGRRALRPAMFVGAALASGAFAISAQEWVALVPAVILFLVAGAVWTDVRTRLFFRVPVPRAELLKHFHREGSNPLAITASRLAFFSLLIPGLSVLSLVLGVVALTKVNSKATPPVGNVSAALGAIIFSLFTTLIWAGWLSARL